MSGVLCLLIGSVADAQPKIPERLPFADEAERQPEFKAFRDGLLTMADRGQYTGVRRVIDRMIQYELGKYGRSAFEQHWRTAKSPQTFLREFAKVLRLGGRFQENGDVFVAPYVWTDFPDDAEDSLYVVVIRPSTKLFDKPTHSARVVALLSNETMRFDLARAGWYEARLVDGRVGFVESNRVRQPNDFHATFRRIGGQWRLAEFFGGSE